MQEFSNNCCRNKGRYTGLKSRKNLDWPALHQHGAGQPLAGGDIMRQIRLILIILAITGQVQAFGQAGNKRPFTFEDMMSLKRIGGPQISPDGKWVLFSAVDVSLKDNKKTPHLWLVPLAGGEARQLTSDPAGEDRGRFAPDGKQLIFISSRDGSSQVWIAGFDSGRGNLSGDAHKLTTIS